MTSCTFCGEPVNPSALSTYRHVSGWAEYRGATGGANAVKDAVSLGEFMHARCFHLHQSGVSKGQESMFGSAA